MSNSIKLIVDGKTVATFPLDESEKAIKRLEAEILFGDAKLEYPLPKDYGKNWVGSKGIVGHSINADGSCNMGCC